MSEINYQEIEEGDNILSNKLSQKFDKSINNETSNKKLFHILLFNSLFAIYGKMLIDIYDLITLSFLGHLKGETLKPYFIACFIQNICFKGVGYGLTRTANMYASRYFGENNFKGIGNTINHGRIITTIFFVFVVILSIFGGPIYSLIFKNVDMNLVITFLSHNSLSIFINLQVVMYITYLNTQNHYVIPPVLDTITALIQYIIFLITFSIYENDINESTQFTFILTSWSLNLTNLIQFIMYHFTIKFYKPCKESNFCINRNSFVGIIDYLLNSFDFIAFFISHFMGNEQLMILVNIYYGDQSSEFNALGSAQKIFFLIQKISIGFTFLALNFTGTLIMKGYKDLLNRFIKLYFAFSFFIILLVILLVEIFANVISNTLTNKPELLSLIPTYIRIIVICSLPSHLETSFQSILSGFKKQKTLAYISLITTIFVGILLGFIFIFLFEMGVYGVFLSIFSIETIISIITIIFYMKYKN